MSTPISLYSKNTLGIALILGTNHLLTWALRGRSFSPKWVPHHFSQLANHAQGSWIAAYVRLPTQDNSNSWVILTACFSVCWIINSQNTFVEKELQNLPGWDLKALQHRKKAKAYSSWEPVHQIFRVLRGSFLRLQEMLSYLLRKSCKSITNSKTGPRSTRQQEQFFCKMILSAVQTTRLAFCVCRPFWCYPVTPLTTTFNWQAQTNESSVPLTASPLEFRCSTPQSYTKLSIISQSTAAALAGLWELMAHCKLLQDTWIIYRFSDTSFLYVLLPTAKLTSKITEYTASEDSEVAVQTPLPRWKGVLCLYSTLSR